MAKWADYAITGVKHAHHGHGAIIEVEARPDSGETLGVPVRFTRLQVVNAILRDGVTFVTAYRNGDKWSKGAEVRVVEIHGEHFLRTDRDRTKADNLGELPELP
jgi:hypothetical protein